MINQFEKKLSPTLFDYFTSIFLMLFGLFFIIWFILNINSYEYYIFVFNLLIYCILPIIVSLPIIFAEKCYINYEHKYFRIDTKIIPFSDILNFDYKDSFTSLRNPLAAIFVLNLKTGEQAKFSCYFKGSNIRVRDMLKKANLTLVREN